MQKDDKALAGAAIEAVAALADRVAERIRTRDARDAAAITTAIAAGAVMHTRVSLHNDGAARVELEVEVPGHAPVMLLAFELPRHPSMSLQ